ncbi:hypothetical protein BKA56DRAFT_738791 [Ilyonectria sp. MPI-CAGE-AT-0026]|nr:hypothetical protein BKA56DRAFT_738791 [Ilyonectria sp. MPI-CAGE-AT-0026]
MADISFQEFSSKYTDANRAPDATAYDFATLGNAVKQLQSVDNGSISQIAPAIIATILCAQRRGDAVPKLFSDLVEGKEAEEVKSLFASFKHAITLTWPFIGLPHCIPACLGLAHELEIRNITVDSQLDRTGLHEADWSLKGIETHQAIYRGVGNSEVGRLMGGFFPEISHVVGTALFGFLIGGSDKVQSLRLSQITVAAAIVGTGATRQARSHFKGSLGLGNSLAAIKAVLGAAESVAAWNGTVLSGEFDFAALEAEAKANLEKA